MGDKWELPAAGKTNPVLFIGDQEKDLQKQIADEVVEQFINQEVFYYPIDIEKTQYHPIYGEALDKKFYPPLHVHCMVEWEGFVSNNDGYNIDRIPSITVHFHKRRLNEDMDFVVREGDFILYGRDYYEIAKLEEPRRVFGAYNLRPEVTATCVKARRGLFEVNEEK
jgi:hypothetical protein